MELEITRHARRRMQQRGVTARFVEKLFEHADVECASTDNCRLYRVTRNRARSLGDEKLGRFALIWSDNTAQVVTVLPIFAGRAGAHYRRKH